MRASRLLTILLTLQTKGRASADALARALEVSVRTIYRDVDELSAAGVPVYAERGPGGGFALLEGYRTRLTGLSEAEAEALPLVLLSEAAADLGVAGAAASARLKLTAALTPPGGASADRVAERFHVDPVGWFGEKEAAPLLPAVAERVWSGRRARIAYDGWSRAGEMDVDPLGLVLKGGRWYLAAAVAGRPRTFRVAAIGALSPIDQPAGRPAGFDLAAYWAEAVAGFHARTLSDRALVRVSSEGLRLMRDLSPLAWRAALRSGRPAALEGWTLARIPVEPGPFGVRTLLRFGSELEVLRPRALRTAVAEEIARLVMLYGEATG